MKFGCYFYTMGHTIWFNTREEAYHYGRNSGFEFTVLERKYNE
jgi:hypothetical protein